MTEDFDEDITIEFTEDSVHIKDSQRDSFITLNNIENEKLDHKIKNVIYYCNSCEIDNPYVMMDLGSLEEIMYDKVVDVK